MINEKLRSLVVRSGKLQLEVAKHFGIIPQQMNRKFSRASFKVSELVRLAEFTGTKLAFIDENDKPVIIFDMNDL